MSNLKYYLITTADERTWKYDQPVIFLGKWCCLYNRKFLWQEMDAITAEPYGLGQKMKDFDYAESRDLKEKLFPLLCKVLNQHHNMQCSERFWKIVLGHWFNRYVSVVLNRVKTLECCLNSYELSGTTSYYSDKYSLAPLDSNEAIWAFNDDEWNNSLFIKILKLLEVKNIEIEEIPIDSNKYKKNYTINNSSLGLLIIKWFYRNLASLAKYFMRDKDALFINTYLPKMHAIKLQLCLGQVPQLFIPSKEWQTKKTDRELRCNLSKLLILSEENDTHFRIICSLVFQLLPVCYLEDFHELSKYVQRLTWPKFPKFIFTSNSFDTNEMFKLWTAQKVESGVKYIVGQHGNNYGTHRYINSTIEESTSDKFITWGWVDGLIQHTPSYIFKFNKKTFNPSGCLLLVEDTISSRKETWDVTYEFENYFNEQLLFVDSLNENPKKELIVRLHHTFDLLRTYELSRWRDFDSDLTIEVGDIHINNLISKSRLVVFSYDSTGMLENLSQNVPTLAFWQNDLDHLRDSAKAHYQVLIDAGIVHLTPDSIANKVNEIWDDIENWWQQDLVQDARNLFCSRYAKVSLNPISELKKLLN